MINNLLASAEAAEVIGIDRSTLSRWAASGRLPVAMRLPGRRGPLLFDRADVERVAAAYRAEISGASS